MYDDANPFGSTEAPQGTQKTPHQLRWSIFVAFKLRNKFKAHPPKCYPQKQAQDGVFGDTLALTTAGRQINESRSGPNTDRTVPRIRATPSQQVQ